MENQIQNNFYMSIFDDESIIKYYKAYSNGEELKANDKKLLGELAEKAENIFSYKEESSKILQSMSLEESKDFIKEVLYDILEQMRINHFLMGEGNTGDVIQINDEFLAETFDRVLEDREAEANEKLSR